MRSTNPTERNNVAQAVAEVQVLSIDLEGNSPQRFSFELGRGKCYQMLFRSRARYSGTLRTLSRCAGVGCVMHDGGLISNLDVRENLLLPIAYRTPEFLDEAALHAREVLAACGQSTDDISRLLMALPGSLTVIERRMVGFVRTILMNPDVVVFDRILDELAPEETQHAQVFHRIWRACFPFRTAIYLDYEGRAHLDHQVPDVCYQIS